MLVDEQVDRQVPSRFDAAVLGLGGQLAMNAQTKTGESHSSYREFGNHFPTEVEHREKGDLQQQCYSKAPKRILQTSRKTMISIVFRWGNDHMLLPHPFADPTATHR